MLSFPSSIRIFIARHPVDFRKAHDGLVAIIRDEFGDDAFDGSVFVFLNRGRDRVKVIHWDRDGLWLHQPSAEYTIHRTLPGDERSQGVDLLAHVGRAASQIDPDRRRQAQHDFTARTTAPTDSASAPG